MSSVTLMTDELLPYTNNFSVYKQLCHFTGPGITGHLLSRQHWFEDRYIVVGRSVVGIQSHQPNDTT